MVSLTDPSYCICQVNNGVGRPFKVRAKRHKVKARVERALTSLTGANLEFMPGAAPSSRFQFPDPALDAPFEPFASLFGIRFVGVLEPLGQPVQRAQRLHPHRVG